MTRRLAGPMPTHFGACRTGASKPVSVRRFCSQRRQSRVLGCARDVGVCHPGAFGFGGCNDRPEVW